MKTLITTTLVTALTVAAFLPTLTFASDSSPVFEASTDTFIEPRIDSDVLMPTRVPRFKRDGSIAVARLDGGRLIPTPFLEEQDWTFLDRRVDMNVSQLGAGTYIQYVPEIAYGSYDTDNKIDEIRLAAANEGFDYVLIYGVGPDAGWASFGGKVLSETGLKVDEDCHSWDGAKAKALLVESYTGQVLGAVTANDIEFNIGQLADRVEGLIETLSKPESFSEMTKA